MLLGGKKKPLKQPKKDDKEVDEVVYLYLSHRLISCVVCVAY